MPGQDSLTSIEYSDFTGGLWERTTERECPKNGLLEAVDCYPQATGGLRAFMSFEPISQTGIANNSLILGLWRPTPSMVYLFCAALEIDAGGAGSHTFRIYALDASSLDNLRTGTWTQVHATTGVTAIDSSIQMVAYRMSLGYQCYFNLPVQQTGSATTGGIYRIVSTNSTHLGGTSRPITSGVAYPNCLAVHQARLLYSGVLFQLPGRIHMTQPGFQTSSTNFFDPIGEKAAPITWMVGNAPSDLVIGKSTWGVVLTQGDVLNPASREMSFAHNYLQSFPAVTESGGIVFMVADQGCFSFSQGGLNTITPNFYGTPMNPGIYPVSFNVINSASTKLATPTVSGNFLFMGNGYVMDNRTQAWFRSSFIPKSKHHATDVTGHTTPFGGRTFVAENKQLLGNEQVLWMGFHSESQDGTADTWTPARSYSFALPLIYNPGSDTQVREIEAHLDALTADSSITCSVYADGEIAYGPETKVMERAGPQKVRFANVKADGGVVKVSFRVASDPGRPAPAEAPLLERVLVGTTDHTRYRQSPRRSP